MWITIEDLPESCSIIAKADTAGGFEVSNLCSIWLKLKLSLLSYIVSSLKSFCSIILIFYYVVITLTYQNFKYNKILTAYTVECCEAYICVLRISVLHKFHSRDYGLSLTCMSKAGKA